MVDLQVTCEKLQDRGERILMETVDLDRPAAARLLEEAGGHVKTAIVMGYAAVDRAEARRRLDQAGGVISRVVDARRTGPGFPVDTETDGEAEDGARNTIEGGPAT
jgi:N-acetylmuramic acid 6-phosphate etherase